MKPATSVDERWFPVVFGAVMSIFVIMVAILATRRVVTPPEDQLARIEVPGGWYVYVTGRYESAVYVPDPTVSHEWSAVK